MWTGLRYLPKDIKIDFELTPDQVKSLEEIKASHLQKISLFIAWHYFQR